MSEEYRPIEVVQVGGPPVTPTPGRPPRSRLEVLLTLLLVGVFLVAACSAFAAWTLYQQREDSRAVQCAYLGFGDARSYDDLEKPEQTIADTFDCDIDGR